MTCLAPFDFEGAAIRVVMRGDAPWFVAADVCRVLEIAKTDRAVSRLDEDEKGAHTVSTLGGPQEMTVVSESGLYALTFTSRKPQAKRFRKWVTGEVLPAIRRTGRFGPEPAEPLPETERVFGMTPAGASAAAAMLRLCLRIYGPEAARRLWQSDPGLPAVHPGSGGPDGPPDIEQFFGECVTVTGDPADTVPARALWSRYADWRRASGAMARSEKAFAQAAAQLAPSMGFTRAREAASRVWRGVKMTEVA